MNLASKIEKSEKKEQELLASAQPIIYSEENSKREASYLNIIDSQSY